MASRVAASALSAIGVSETITSSKAEYEELAVFYGNNKTARANLREKVKNGRDHGLLYDLEVTLYPR